MTELVDLAALLDPGSVRARVPAADWEEAVDQVGALLVDAGAALPDYVEAMKAGFRELGPYAVIAPGIALPHARPEQGAVRPGVAVITLAEPVTFDHPRHDPVDVVIAFSATDKQTHLAALKQLAELLSDAELVARLREADTDAALLAAVIRNRTESSEP
jgi:mannitol/fructose-specific phosphotransferase system IIA component (Ntr-type)